MRLIGCEVDDVYPCPTESIIHLDSTASELILNGGFSWELFWVIFEGCFGMWVIGLGLGVLISQIRKSKRVP